eukprot:jgi/Ulvmu1/6628/UM003_0266.1
MAHLAVAPATVRSPPIIVPLCAHRLVVRGPELWPVVAMISTRALLLLFGFLTAVVIPTAWGEGAGAVIDEEDDEYADPEVVEPALLVAYKSVKTAKIVQGCNVTIAVSLYNVGKGSATDVSVEDVLPQDFELIEGKLTSSYGALDPGASVDMEYIAIPRVGDNKFIVRPAKVVYTSAKETKPRTLLSTTPYMDVLSTRQNMELHLVKVGKYLSLGVLRTRRDWQNSLAVITVTAIALAAYYLYSSVTARRADALRRAAERDLGVAGKLSE